MFVEFCNRWVINSWDSYFNTYAERKWGMTSLPFSFGRFIRLTFSILVTCLGVLSCSLNGFIYPFLVFKMNIPIPIMSITAGVLQSACLFLF